jgi:hypothetical protein
LFSIPQTTFRLESSQSAAWEVGWLIGTPEAEAAANVAINPLIRRATGAR